MTHPRKSVSDPHTQDELNRGAAGGVVDSPEPEQPLSLFNDASGHPDPNGIMWIDPLQLVHRFPEKYGDCFFGKGSKK